MNPLNGVGIELLNSGACGTDWIAQPGGGELVSVNPADGTEIALVAMASESDYEAVAAATGGDPFFRASGRQLERARIQFNY